MEQLVYPLTLYLLNANAHQVSPEILVKIVRFIRVCVLLTIVIGLAFNHPMFSGNGYLLYNLDSMELNKASLRFQTTRPDDALLLFGQTTQGTLRNELKVELNNRRILVTYTTNNQNALLESLEG